MPEEFYSQTGTLGKPSRPSYERVRELLDYEPDTGIFRWRVRRRGRGNLYPGGIAGHYARRGYVEIRIDGYMVHAHRLAWLWMTGEWPPSEIDHKNKDRNDTKWQNLRLATHSQNGANKGPNKNNKLGIKGVRFSRGRYEARIWMGGKSVQIGRYSTAKEASAAYIAESQKLHGKFCYVTSL